MIFRVTRDVARVRGSISVARTQRVNPAHEGELYPPEDQWYLKADFVNELSDKAIALHVEHGSRLPTMKSTMHLYPIDGTAHRIGGNETAFSYRDATWAEVIVGSIPILLAPT
jgi:hypothetical protein